MDKGKYTLTFGKEYELEHYIRWFNFKGKSEDGSGPSEITTPIFANPFTSVLWEYFLYSLYGKSLFNYYITRRGDEQKGSHLHYSIIILNENDRKKDYLLKYPTDAKDAVNLMRSRYYVHAVLILMCRRLFTLHDRFRNTIEHWCEHFIIRGSLFEEIVSGDYYSRRYCVLTPNRNRKDNLTFEVRIAEGSLCCEIPVILIAEGIYLKIAFEASEYFKYFERYCNIIEDNYLHLKAIRERPKEVSIPIIKDNDVCRKIVEAFETIGISNTNESEEEWFVTNFTNLTKIALDGLKKYGKIYSNVELLIKYLETFYKEYCLADRHRVEFATYMYNTVKSLFSREFVERVWRDFGEFYVF